MSQQEEDEKLFDGLNDRLRAEPVSIEQADARVATLLEQHLKGRTGRLHFTIDPGLPPETVIKVAGSSVTMSVDAWQALERHEKRTHNIVWTGRSARRVDHGTSPPYRGS